ncbi:MAG: helix-turn-helix domain-containing protein [Agriterribacter sp.]
MGAHKSLRITYTNDETWFARLAEQLKADYTEDSASFDNDIGKGNFYQVVIDWGLQARKIEVTFHQPVVFSRKVTTHILKGHYMLLSNLSDQYIEASTQEHQFKLGYSSHNGIFFSSPFLAATFSFTPHVLYHLLFVIITHEKVKDFIARQPDVQYPLLQSIINTNKPIYHVETLDAGLMAILKDIDRNLNDQRPNNLLLHSRILELCYKMLQKVDQRKSHKGGGRIHRDDIKKLNEVRRYLLDNYQEECLPITEVAKKVAMSPTKFKKLFKQMFGNTYYQFYKNVRMHKAWELLEQHKLSASEVAYKLGYSNLSKFSKAFKDVFSITPGKIADG